MQNNYKLVYLASPFTHPNSAVEYARLQGACRAASAMMREGLMVFSPIAHSHSLMSIGELPNDWEYWRDFCLLMVAKCDELHVLRLDGWSESVGVTAEIAIAEGLGIPVVLRTPERINNG